MSKERFLERQSELLKAAARLSEAAEPETSLVRDAVIQRFEFTFELMWKTLKLYLECQGHECPSPRAALKTGFAHGFFGSADNADAWLQMLEDRNLTSHTYDDTLAQLVYARIVSKYTPMLSELAGRVQTLSWG